MNPFQIIISTIFVNNYVFSQFLGICPFLGVSSKVETATGMSVAVAFVMTMSSAITYLIQHYVLNPLHIQYLQTIVFILVIASLVQFVEMVIKKLSPSLYQAMGVFLPLITTNCIVLGVAIVNIQNEYGLFKTLANAIGASIGFALALILMSSLRERLELIDVPEALKGFPLALMAAGLMSIAFTGFAGLV
ncbi:MAG: electron transport complex subunit RsxA [Tissierellia bacterium]|nr:electron transport complex subunit RsxA [Tissierellia bacterium]